MEQAVRLFVPNPVAQYAETSPQVWINRFLQNPKALAYKTDTFQGRNVYSLTEHQGATTLTLYVNPSDYLPTGFVAQTSDYTFTQIVHHYEVVPLATLSFDPFAWPPIPLQSEPFQTFPRSTP